MSASDGSRPIWGKFWWADWRNDLSLQTCSLDARGLWMEMLCIAHEEDPYGHVTIRGRAPSVAKLASLVRASEDKVAALLQELEEAGVFSRTEEGVIFSRRMVRESITFRARGDEGGTRGSFSGPQGTVARTARARPFRKGDAPAKAARVFGKADGRCWFCGTLIASDTFRVVHLKPVRNGGTSDESNLVPACGACAEGARGPSRLQHASVNTDTGSDMSVSVSDTDSDMSVSVSDTDSDMSDVSHPIDSDRGTDTDSVNTDIVGTGPGCLLEATGKTSRYNGIGSDPTDSDKGTDTDSVNTDTHRHAPTRARARPREEARSLEARKEESSLRSDSSPPGGATPDCVDVSPEDVESAFASWNVLAEARGLPVALKLDRRRRAKLRSRLREIGGLVRWESALEIVGATPFLSGRTAGDWCVDLDFLCQPSKLRRVLEGVYSGRRLDAASGAISGERGPSPRADLTRLDPSGREAPPHLTDPWGLQAWRASIPDMRVADFGGETRLALGGFDPVGVGVEIAEAAGLDPTWRGRWDALADWLREGIWDPDVCLPAIRRRADRLRVPIFSIRVFHEAVCAAAGKFSQGRTQDA